MKHFFLTVGFWAFAFGLVSGQTYRQYIKAADAEYNDHLFYSAMKHYQEAMSIEGETLEVLYKYAESARMFASYTYADTAYTKVVSADTAGIYPLALFSLGEVKKKQGEYLAAQQYYQLFADGYSEEYPEQAKKAVEEIEDLNWAIKAVTEIQDDVVIEQLDESINSPYSEFAPVQVGNDIYFSTQNYLKEIKKGTPKRMFSRVMKTSSDGGDIEVAAWNDEARLTAHAVFTDEMDRVYYTLCDYVGESGEIRCQLYYRDIDPLDGEIYDPVKLPESINKPGFTTTDPRLGFDKMSGETWLYFVSDRDGGLGGLDIWASVVSDSAGFSTPFNLTEINTSGDDRTPMFQAQSQTLYFSSNGRQGFGGFDIYSIERRDGKWVNEKHLSAPYNTSYDDTHFWINRERTMGYFASSRLGSHVLEPEFEACCNDIYRFTVQVVDLDVLTFNKKNDEPLNGVTVELRELTVTGDLKLGTLTNKDGNDFGFELKKGSEYVLLATRPGFLPVRDTIDMRLSENTSRRTLERKLFLTPTTVDLNVLSFNKKTMNPLKGVEVRLAVDGQEVDFQKNKKGNDVNFTLERGNVYELIGSKVAYFPDTVVIDLSTDLTTTELAEKLLLKPKEIEDFPPLVIYFDNDQPNPRTYKTTTELDYGETYDAYRQKKDLFVKEYVKSLVGRDSSFSARRMSMFFDRELQNAFLELEAFTANILEIMEDGGFKVELVIQGFTSPRASADYNYNLSQRRSDCLKNHFERWNGGVLKPYLDSGRITLEVIGYGEKLAPQWVSDRLDDERGSIYSLIASVERKVAIIGARKVAEN